MNVQVRTWLRLEGVAVFVAGAAIYSQLGGDWIWFLPLLLVPDLSAAGYLKGPVVGALMYNAFHNWATGLLVLGAGLATGLAPLAFAGAILMTHTGIDRAVGYGLKLPSGFQDTHLGRIGKSRAAKSEDARAAQPSTPATMQPIAQ